MSDLTAQWFFRCCLVVTLSCVLPAFGDVGEPDDPAPTLRAAPATTPVAPARVEPVQPTAVPAFVESEASMLLVVPVRYTIVQFAFDMAKLRPMAIVAYEDNPTNKSNRLFVWNPALYDWMSMDPAEFKNASFMKTPPKDVIFIGSDTGNPLPLSEAATWATTKRLFTSFTIAPIVNSLNEVLAFSMDEWKLLARKYDLKLKDLNEDRRRYGKWGQSNRIPDDSQPAPKAKPTEEADKEITPLPPTGQAVSEVVTPVPVSIPVSAPAPENK